MPLDLDFYSGAYEGVWVNWSKGMMQGSTLTLSHGNASILTNSLAVFITILGAQVWIMLTFVTHQLSAFYKQESRHHPIHRRQQVILRNTPTDMSTARRLLSLVWEEKAHGIRRLWPAVAMLATAVLHFAIFAAMGTLASSLVASGPEVLIKYPGCGVVSDEYQEWISGVSLTSISPSADAPPLDTETSSFQLGLSLQYAQKCYMTSNEDTSVPRDCLALPRPVLHSTTRTNQTCPFNASICRSDASIVTLDSGVLDSRADFGINAQDDDRLTYQHLISCAILNATNRLTAENVSSENDGVDDDVIAQIFWGPAFVTSPGSIRPNNLSTYGLRLPPMSTTRSYKLATYQAYAVSDPQWSENDFDPIPELRSDSGDTKLIFLTDSSFYSQAVEDPWFSAHRKQPTRVKNLTVYRADQNISTVACLKQHQFCTGRGLCTRTGGFDQIQNDDSFNRALNGRQNATYDRLLRAVSVSDIATITPYLADSPVPLKADAVSLNTAATLPSNQWELELSRIHAFMLAHLQRTVTAWGTGQGLPDARYLQPPVQQQDKWFCSSMMVRSAAMQSFSVLKLTLILSLGSLVIVLSLVLEDVIAYVQQYTERGRACKQRWQSDDMISLLSARECKEAVDGICQCQKMNAPG